MVSRSRRVALLVLVFFSLSCFPASIQAQRWFVTGQNADLMLSGVDFNNTGGALMFNHPSDIASDGVHFLLCDRFNNRVLVWNTLPTKWDAQPDLVLGQRNFTDNNPGTSKSEMNWAGNVSVGSNGRVAVADTFNDRILIWNQFPTQSGQAADISISLRALHGSLPGSWPYEWPWGVWTDGTRLVATATRVVPTILFWNSLKNVDDQVPDYKINLPQFGSPRNISTDGSTYFFVSDHNASVNGNHSGTFFWNSFPQQTDQPYDFYREEWIKGSKLPNGQFAAGGISDIYFWTSVPTSAGQNPYLTVRNGYYKNGDGPSVLFAGGRLYVNNYNGNNVQVYNSIPTSWLQLPDFALGSPSVDVNTLETINFIGNPNVSTDGTVLIATGFEQDVSIWKSLPQRSGQAPDVKIKLDFGMNLMGNALFGGKLVVASQEKLYVWNSLPLNGEAPSYIIRDRIGSFAFDQGGGVGPSVALDQRFFYLSGVDGRIAIWQGIPQTGNEIPFVTIAGLDAPMQQLRSDGTYLCAPGGQKVYIFRVADIEKGGTVQPFMTLQNPSNPTLGWLSGAPSAITINNSLAVADAATSCVFLWKNLADAGDLNRVIILGQAARTWAKPAIGVNRLFWPAYLAAYQDRLWVGEVKFSSRLVQFTPSAEDRTKVDLSVPAGGSVAAATPGWAEATQVGYVAAAATSGSAPYGTAVFSYKQNGVTVSETGVPVSPPTTAARLFIDYRSSVPAIPGRISAGYVNINTGIAVANNSSALANVTYTLRDTAGASIAIGHGTLAAGAHFAKFIDQLREAAPDFVLPANFQAAVQFASLEIFSDQPVSILALRMTINQRGETLFTTTPIADLAKPPAGGAIFFPQFVDGGGYTTILVLLNTSSGAETGTLQMLDDWGTPLVVSYVGSTAGSMFKYSIPKGGAVRFQTDGAPTTTRTGWVKLTPDAGTSTPVGAGVFGYNPGNFLVTESGVPTAAATTHARIYVDMSLGHGTGLAIGNPGSTSATITFKAYQSDGVTGIGTNRDPFQIPANGHIARFANELVSFLPTDFTGVLDITSSTPLAALTMRSLYNERNEFLLTTFPIADMIQSAPSPMVFPQIADGGGYVTQFILIGAGGASGVTLNFYGQDGKPLPVGK